MSTFGSEETLPLYSVNNAHEPLLRSEHSTTAIAQDPLKEGSGPSSDNTTAANPTMPLKKKKLKPLSTTAFFFTYLWCLAMNTPFTLLWYALNIANQPCSDNGLTYLFHWMFNLVILIPAILATSFISLAVLAGDLESRLAVCAGGAAAGGAAMVAVVLWSGIEFLVPQWYDWLFWAGVGMQPGALPVGIIAWALDIGKGGSSLECPLTNSLVDDDDEVVVIKEMERTAADVVV